MEKFPNQKEETKGVFEKEQMGLRFILWISVFWQAGDEDPARGIIGFWQIGCHQMGIAITIPDPISPAGIKFHIDVKDSDSF